VEFQRDDLNSDELFDTFPEIIFGSLRKQMLLGILPAQTVGVILEPLLSNFYEIMLTLTPDLRIDFENILRIYPDVAARFHLHIKPPLAEALSSLVKSLGVSAQISKTDDRADTGAEMDLAAERQKPFISAEISPVTEGQGFFTTDRGNTIFLEFSWSIGDDFISFDHKPSQIEIDVHICGTYALTLGPAALAKKIESHRLLEILNMKTCSENILQLIEKSMP
jgi:hypothetical protein